MLEAAVKSIMVSTDVLKLMWSSLFDPVDNYFFA